MSKKATIWTTGVWRTIDNGCMWVWVIAKGKHSSEDIDCMWSSRITALNEQEALEKAKKVFIDEYNQGTSTKNTKGTKAA